MGFKVHLLAAVLESLPLASYATALPGTEDSTSGFSPVAARQNAPQIFNAVHDAMRQWGSSVHHNGMSFFLATAPQGALFHHGNNRRESPTDPDWLAYEMEHAENFARGRRGRGPPGPPGGGPPGGGPPGEGPHPPPAMYEMDAQQISFDGYGRGPAPWDDEETEPEGGWLHVYRTTRPMRYIYVDGMSGGKTSMGTLDTQDYLLRGVRDGFEEPPAKQPPSKRAPGGPMNEQLRALDLCKLCEEWQLDGIVRMEAGFEIIQCDFSNGLEEVQATQRPPYSGDRNRAAFIGSMEYVRALSERYQGIGASRTVIDYSSMVSAFFFPVNLTNPDAKRPDLPRLSSTTDDELLAIKTKLSRVIAARREVEPASVAIDWQGISDLIVGRYADRLQYMAEKTDEIKVLRYEIEVLLTLFIDYAAEELDIPAARERCTNFYLRSASPQTESDQQIYTALERVTDEICTKLFEVRDIISQEDESAALSKATEALQALIAWLGWARFKRCPACGLDEVCLIPMWPIGTVEDYKNPRCLNKTGGTDGDSYWGRMGRPGGGNGRPPPKEPDTKSEDL